MPRRRRPRAPHRTPQRLAIRADQRRRLLDAAGRTLAERGLAGLNVRELGADVGASSTVVYTIFGGRDALLLAVYEDALEQLHAAMAAVPAAEPMPYLVALAHAYRRFAIAHPHVYAILQLTDTGIAGAALRESKAHALLVAGVERCIALEVFVPGDARLVADTMWAMVHGLVSLELVGYYTDEATATQRFLHAGFQLFSSFLRTPPSSARSGPSAAASPGRTAR